MAEGANDALRDAITVARNNTPAVPANTGGSQAPVTPSDSGAQKPVQGLPDIKDKTTEGQQEATQVPVQVVQEERRRRQEAQDLIKATNKALEETRSENAKLQRDVASLMGQLNGMQNAQAAQPVQQQQEVAPPPDVMLQPEEWSNWAIDRIMGEVDHKMLGLGRDIFNQRMVWSNRMATEKYGEQMVAEATTAAVNAGLMQQAMADFDPTDWCIRWYQQQQGIRHFQAGPGGQLDPKAYNERLIGQLFNSPEFWQQAVQQPAVQNALTNAMRPPEQQQQVAQPVAQQPAQMQQAPQQAVPQYQQQPQSLPQSMAHQTGSGNVNVVPMPSVNDSLKSALIRPSQPRTNMGVA